MQLLVHLGLNKCASTYIQQALAAAQAPLRRKGVFYAVEGTRCAQYGLSRHYGFGPDVAGVTPRSLGWLAAEAERRGWTRMIVSSEYLSLCRPAAIAAFGAEAQFLIFSREPVFWIGSLFSQYVRTVDAGPHFRSINAFADHVLANGAVALAERHRAWADAVDDARLCHYRIGPGQEPEDVLAPFARFAGVSLRPARGSPDNRSLPPGALFLTGLLRQAVPSSARDRLLALIAAHDCAWVPVPEDYLTLDAARLARIETAVTAPSASLPIQPLPVSRDAAACSAAGRAA